MISPLAYVDSAAKIGKNVTIQPFAFIEGNVEIGDDCIIMSGTKNSARYPHGKREQGTSQCRSGCRTARLPLYGREQHADYR